MNSDDGISGRIRISIEWNRGTLGEWTAILKMIERLPLTQTLHYAHAAARERKLYPRLGQIYLEQKLIGVVQILELRWLRFLHIVHIERGPVWIGIVPNQDVQEAVYRDIRAHFPRGVFNWLNFIPNLPLDSDSEEFMSNCGFVKAGAGYRTGWLKLRSLPRPAKKALHAVEAKVSGIEIEIDKDANSLNWLLDKVSASRAKSHRTINLSLIRRLKSTVYSDGGLMLLRAFHGCHDDRHPVAGMFIILHGRSATALTSWREDGEVPLCAIMLLISRALRSLVEQGVDWLDLGDSGISPLLGVERHDLTYDESRGMTCVYV